MLCQLFETHHSFTSLHVACRLRLDRQPAYFLEDFQQLFVFFRVAVTANNLLVLVSLMAMLSPYWVKFRSLSS